MKKLFMGSAVLTIFAFSILLFQISCKKTAEAQTPSSTVCFETATVVITVKFRPNLIPSSTRTSNNVVYIWSESLTPAPNYKSTYAYDFRDVGNSAQRVYTFKSIIPGVYKYYGQTLGYCRFSISNPMC